MEASVWLWTRVTTETQSWEKNSGMKAGRDEGLKWQRQSNGQSEWNDLTVGHRDEGWLWALFNIPTRHTHSHKNNRLTGWLTRLVRDTEETECVCLCVWAHECVSVYSSLSLSATAPFLSLPSAANPCLQQSPPLSVSPLIPLSWFTGMFTLSGNVSLPLSLISVFFSLFYTFRLVPFFLALLNNLHTYKFSPPPCFWCSTLFFFEKKKEKKKKIQMETLQHSSTVCAKSWPCQLC